MSNEPGILPEPIPFGKYYLLERISVGGMAEIYKAKAFGVEGFERLLAVKKILSSIAEDESFIEMFIDEAKIAGQLNHPNIAQIYDLGKEEGSYYIALEYISGKDMKTIFERARRVGEEVDIPQVCHVVMKVCEGLEHAHNKTDSQGRDLNIVHRDISPQNILISYEGEVKIIDFGIAKAQGKTSQTQVGVLKGKFSYMSPEQVRGLHVDHRSDIFSLGIVMYEMLTLERLFLGESDFDTLEKIRKVEMSPPSLYNPNIPKELEDIVLKALAQNPDDRFQSAAELAEALERFMRHQDYYYKSTDLAEFMKDSFAEDLEFEQKKLEYYQSLDLERPDEGEEGGDEQEGAGLVWDEEEMETQIFDQGPASESPPNAQPSGAQAPASAAASGEMPAPRDSQNSEAVEVVGPDNKVDTIGPEDSVEPIEEDTNAPTVEYDRWSVEDQLEEIGADVDGQQPTQEQNRRADSGSRRAAGTQPAQEGQPATSPGGSSGSNRLLVIGGTAAAIMVATLGILYGIFGNWGGEAGKLYVSPNPKNVQVVVDGEEVHQGKTPITLEAEPGTVRVAIKKEGYETIERLIQLKAGKTRKMTPTLEKARKGKGEIFVKSTPPGAQVKVDGSSVDAPTPVTVENLEKGTHRVVVSKEGYLDHEKSVELDTGEARELDVELRPETVELSVKSDPEGADFEITGKESEKTVASGETPDVVEELDGGESYNIKFERSGYEDVEKTFEPGGGKKALVEATLGSDGREAAPEPDESEPTVTEEDETETSSEPTSTVGTTEAPSPASKSDKESAPAKEASSSGGSETAKTTTEKKPKQKQPEGTGYLKINSRPAARVHIDGKDTGEHTPLLNYEVSAGKHEISLTNEEFGLNKTYYVDLKPGETKTIINRSK